MRNFTRLDRLHVFLIILAIISVCCNIFYSINYYVTEEAEVGELRDEVDAEAVAPADAAASLNSSKVVLTVQQGDTLLKIFTDAGIAPADAHAVGAGIKDVFEVSKLQIGDKVEIQFPQEQSGGDDYYSRPSYVKLITDEKVIVVSYDLEKKRYIAEISVIPLTHKEVFAHGVINDSLYVSAGNAGVAPNILMEFIKLFSYDVDFQRDIQIGDTFEVLYDCMINDKGEKVKDGNILSASITTSGKRKEIFRFTHQNNQSDYYDRNGNSIRTTLLKTPINGARISSGFGMRKHPILGYSKMHKGLDYAAPRGTPIFAAGDGVIVLVKALKTGYGKHLAIKHSSKFSTLYAHLDRFATNARPGKRVSQGEVIGFVGSTGRATGPHLHYEVHERGKQVNPSKISFPKFPTLTGVNLQKFKNQLQMIEGRILEYRKNAARIM